MNRRRYLGALGLGAFVAGCLDDQEAETEPQERDDEESGQPDEDGEETDRPGEDGEETDRPGEDGEETDRPGEDGEETDQPDEDDDDGLSADELAPDLASSAEVDPGFSYSEDDEVLLRITHEAGDELKLDNLELLFHEDVVQVATFSTETDWQSGIGSSSADEVLVLRLNGEKIETGDTFVVGDTLSIEIGADADDATLETLAPETEHEVIVVHKPVSVEISTSSVLLPPAN